MSHDTCTPKLSRRGLLRMSGFALAGVWGQSRIPFDSTSGRSGAAAQKSLFLPPPDSRDPVVHSRAENLFWSEIMMEHADLFAMLMPGAEMASQRTQAENFRRSFQSQLDRARSGVDRNTYAAFNRSTVDLIKPFIDYTVRQLDLQLAGKQRTFVFPLHFDAAIREAKRATNRLEKLAAGDTSMSYTEVIDFWSGIMSDYCEFVAHLLDPQEQELISQALDASAVFQGFQKGNRMQILPGGEVLTAAQELLDYTTTLHEGVENGTVKSIIHPMLADHMRRSTQKFVDELRRTVSKT